MAARRDRARRPRGSAERDASRCVLSQSSDHVGFDARIICCRALIGLDDPADERVADDVAGAEADHGDAGDALELADRVGEAGLVAPLGQVDLLGIAADHHAAAHAEAGQEHLHLLRRGVLRLVEDDEGVGERAAAHEGDRRDLDLARRRSAARPARSAACRRARRRAGADRDRPSPSCRRAGSRAARRPRPPGATGSAGRPSRRSAAAPPGRPRDRSCRCPPGPSAKIMSSRASASM